VGAPIFVRAVALVLLPGLAMAEVTNNGKFETFTTGLPTGWTYTAGDGSATLQDTTTVSPFTNVYGTSTSSVALLDGATAVGNPTLSQTFTTQTGTVTMSFDFRIGGFGAQPWLIVGASDTAGNFNNIRIDDGGQFRLNDATSTVFSTPLTIGTWYQVVFVLDYVAQTYSGSLTPFGGSAVPWSNRQMFNGVAANLSRITVGDNFGTASQQNSTLWLDNISVVPEPASIALMALGAGLFSQRRWRRDRRHENAG
jgi:hypothetical protein